MMDFMNFFVKILSMKQTMNPIKEKVIAKRTNEKSSNKFKRRWEVLMIQSGWTVFEDKIQNYKSNSEKIKILKIMKLFKLHVERFVLKGFS
jgi:carbohydrate-binding DOMON domain-containing protein